MKKNILILFLFLGLFINKQNLSMDPKDQNIEEFNFNELKAFQAEQALNEKNNLIKDKDQSKRTKQGKNKEYKKKQKEEKRKQKKALLSLNQQIEKKQLENAQNASILPTIIMNSNKDEKDKQNTQDISLRKFQKQISHNQNQIFSANNNGDITINTNYLSPEAERNIKDIQKNPNVELQKSLYDSSLYTETSQEERDAKRINILTQNIGGSFGSKDLEFQELINKQQTVNPDALRKYLNSNGDSNELSRKIGIMQEFVKNMQQNAKQILLNREMQNTLSKNQKRKGRK